MNQSTIINKIFNEHKINWNDYKKKLANYTVKQIIVLNELTAIKHT